jgi:hypothetical protein
LLSGTTSMRQASTTMSWVAPAKPMNTATAAVMAKLKAGRSGK